MFQNPRIALIALVVINLLWGSTYVVSKALMAPGATEVSPLAVSFWRLALASLVLGPLAWRHRPRRPLTGQERRSIVILGLIGTAMATMTQFIGTNLSLATNAALITALEAVATVLLAAIFLGERLTPRLMLSCVAALGGVLMLSDLDWGQLDLFSGRYALGNGLLVVSILCYAIYTIVGKGLVATLPPLVITGYPFVLATAAMGLICLAFDPTTFTAIPTWTGAVWTGLVFLGIACTAVAYLVWNAVLVSGNVGTMSLTLYIQPVFGALAAWALLGERLSEKALIGAAAVVAAVMLVAVRPRQARDEVHEVAHGTASMSEGR